MASRGNALPRATSRNAPALASERKKKEKEGARGALGAKDLEAARRPEDPCGALVPPTATARNEFADVRWVGDKARTLERRRTERRLRRTVSPRCPLPPTPRARARARRESSLFRPPCPLPPLPRRSHGSARFAGLPRGPPTSCKRLLFSAVFFFVELQSRVTLGVRCARASAASAASPRPLAVPAAALARLQLWARSGVRCSPDASGSRMRRHGSVG